jgi:hypothetical protein
MLRKMLWLQLKYNNAPRLSDAFEFCIQVISTFGWAVIELYQPMYAHMLIEAQQWNSNIY